MYVKFGKYGQEREVNATDEELKLFEVLQSICPDLRLTRKSDAYLTAVLGDWDIARFKYTNRAKWVSFPLVQAKSPKNYLESVEEVSMYADSVRKSVSVALKFSD